MRFVLVSLLQHGKLFVAIIVRTLKKESVTFLPVVMTEHDTNTIRDRSSSKRRKNDNTEQSGERYVQNGIIKIRMTYNDASHKTENYV